MRNVMIRSSEAGMGVHLEIARGITKPGIRGQSIYYLVSDVPDEVSDREVVRVFSQTTLLGTYSAPWSKCGIGKIINEYAAAMGRSKSPRKAAAARENGAKGKRPDVIQWSSCEARRIYWSNNGLPPTEIISTDGEQGGDQGIRLTGEIDGKKAEKFLIYGVEKREDGKYHSTREVTAEAISRAKNAIRAKLRRMK